MTFATINDLYNAYCDLCGEHDPEMTRDELQRHFWDWCDYHGRPRAYGLGHDYLHADDGAFQHAE